AIDYDEDEDGRPKVHVDAR
nr:RecName: Full=Fibrinogen beta chain; Contains: RecName: Full=Fibrinopeptide B [Sus scrofa]prf//650771AC fibrinopeptide B [Sus scrofa domesticus]